MVFGKKKNLEAIFICVLPEELFTWTELLKPKKRRFDTLAFQVYGTLKMCFYDQCLYLNGFGKFYCDGVEVKVVFACGFYFVNGWLPHSVGYIE